MAMTIDFLNSDHDKQNIAYFEACFEACFEAW